MNNNSAALAQEIHDYFLRSGKTLAFAESCTGGLLSAVVTAKPGASNYFLGSVVSYARSAKVQLLGVPLNLIQVLGEVSLPVAKHMAVGARHAFAADWSVSVTGIAGPTGGSKDKPVGTVCFAVSGPGFEKTERKIFEVGSREAVQQHSVEHALKLLLLGIQS